MLETLAHLDQTNLLALTALIVAGIAYKVVDHILTVRRNKTFADQVGEQLAAMQTNLHERTLASFRLVQHELTTQMMHDRKELAHSLIESFPAAKDCTFRDTDRDMLTRLHNSHLADGTRRLDGTLRWHNSAQVEDQVGKTARCVERIADKLGVSV